VLKALTKHPFFKDDSGATAIEYGLIAGAMGLCIITSYPFVVAGTKSNFTTVANLFLSIS
jgi:Flp pilus assembly pilin Flp